MLLFYICAPHPEGKQFAEQYTVYGMQRDHDQPSPTVHLYAAPAWCDCASAADRERVDQFLRKIHRAGYSPRSTSTTLQNRRRRNYWGFLSLKLLCKVKNNECHVLRQLFPPLAQRSHFLRPRAHEFVLTSKNDKNYIPRILYRLSNSVVKS